MASRLPAPPPPRRPAAPGCATGTRPASACAPQGPSGSPGGRRCARPGGRASSACSSRRAGWRACRGGWRPGPSGSRSGRRAKPQQRLGHVVAGNLLEGAAQATPRASAAPPAPDQDRLLRPSSRVTCTASRSLPGVRAAILAARRITASSPASPAMPTTIRSLVSHCAGDAVLGTVPLQALLDPVGDPQQGQLAQRGEVPGPEVVGQGGVDRGPAGRRCRAPSAAAAPPGSCRPARSGRRGATIASGRVSCCATPVICLVDVARATPGAGCSAW